MRGLYIESGVLRFRDDLPEPEPGPGETLVEVVQVGICATDLALVRGYMGFAGTPGHEFVGRALGGRFAGRLVVGEINAACGRCRACESGLGRHCSERSVLGILGRPGAFAARLALPEGNLHAVPEGVSTDAATFTEPLAAAFEILDQCPVTSGMRALVAGDGRLGLLCAQVLALAGAEVTLAGRHPERAALLPPDVHHRTGLLEAGGPRRRSATISRWRPPATPACCSAPWLTSGPAASSSSRRPPRPRLPSTWLRWSLTRSRW